MHDKALLFRRFARIPLSMGYSIWVCGWTPVSPISSYENRVYQFGTKSAIAMVKFYRPERWSAEQILEEHQFALQLVEDEVPVAPLLFNDSTLHQHQGFYLLFPSLGGRQFKRITLIRWNGLAATGACRRAANSALLPARKLACRSTCWNRVRCLSRRR